MFVSFCYVAFLSGHVCSTVVYFQQYEYSSANNALATVPKTELADLRTKAKLLQAAEEKIEKLEELEKHLRQCIEDLRKGKVSTTEKNIVVKASGHVFCSTKLESPN